VLRFGRFRDTPPPGRGKRLEKKRRAEIEGGGTSRPGKLPLSRRLERERALERRRRKNLAAPGKTKLKKNAEFVRGVGRKVKG